MSAIMVVDALWGDSGKGKVADFLAMRQGASHCVRAGTGTNAGHSLYLPDGGIMRTSQLPLAGIRNGARLLVPSGTAVDPDILATEREAFAAWDVAGRIGIDAQCPVITPEHRRRERDDSHLRERVGSTCSGTGAAQADFILRRAGLARDDDRLRPYVCDVAAELNQACEQGKTVVIEGSQGTLISLALGADYPCCTSGNCTTAAFLDDTGLSWRHLAEVVLVVKAVPSRVGTGPLPDELDAAAQDSLGMAEYGVKTGRRRRKSAGIPWELLQRSVMLNGPTQITLTFCDHYDPDIRDARKLTSKVRELIRRVEAACGVPVTMVDTGKPLGALWGL